METRLDQYGRMVTKTIDGDREVYACEGVTIGGPIGWGWTKALSVLEAHAPAGAEG